jgi:hypothetical protein
MTKPVKKASKLGFTFINLGFECFMQYFASKRDNMGIQRDFSYSQLLR